jgi:hypothetical protein
VALISPADQQHLRDAFAAMTRRVRLLFFSQTLDCDTCPETRQILDELPPLSDRISIEEVNLILDRDKAAVYGVDRAPAIAITFEDTPSEGTAAPTDAPAWKDSRIRFLGAPAGYEFISLVQAVLIAGGHPLRLSEESRGRIAALNQPITMQVFTTPT